MMTPTLLTPALDKCPQHGLSIGPEGCTACALRKPADDDQAPAIEVLPPDTCTNPNASQSRFMRARYQDRMKARRDPYDRRRPKRTAAEQTEEEEEQTEGKSE